MHFSNLLESSSALNAQQAYDIVYTSLGFNEGRTSLALRSGRGSYT